MEVINVKRLSTQAKFIGTLVSIAGAIIMTLYQGPSIIPSHFKSNLSQHLLLATQLSDWVLGGILLTIDAIFASMYIITQAIVLKKYPVVINLMFSYCLICTVLSALASFIVETDLSSFSLQPNTRLFSVLYSVSIYTQCYVNLHRKLEINLAHSNLYQPYFFPAKNSCIRY